MSVKWFVLTFMLVLFCSKTNHAGAKSDRKLMKDARKKSLETLQHASNLKTSWCMATDIEQSIQEEGCETKVIQNKACVGQCFSYYSPGTFPMRSARRRTKYCYFCKPSLKSWTKVSLECPGKEHNQVDKLVEVIYACSCRNCSKGPKSSENSLRWDLARFWLIW